MAKTTKSNCVSSKETVLGWMYLIFEVFFFPSLLYTVNDYLCLSGAELNFVFFCCNFLAVVLIFRKYLVGGLRRSGNNVWMFLQGVVLDFAVYWLCSTALRELIGHFAPQFTNLNDQNIVSMAKDNFWCVAVGTVLLVPTAEECLVRGAIFRSLLQTNRVLAYAASTAVFCLIHMLSFLKTGSPGEIVLGLLQYVPAGICLARSLERSESIFAPILIHTAINTIAVLSLR